MSIADVPCRWSTPTVVNLDEVRMAAAVRELSPTNRQLLAIVMAKVVEVEDDEGEKAACELIDRLIEIIRTS